MANNNRIIIEAIVVCPLALVSGIRGMTAIINHSMWIEPKYGPAIELTGKAATFSGIGYIGLALILLAGWAATKIPDRIYGVALCLCAGAIKLFGFAGSFLTATH